jgi:bacterioferritin-associated ferredoxin
MSIRIEVPPPRASRGEGKAREPGPGRSDVIVCVCRNVTDSAIRAGARAGKPLEAVLRETGAGGGCGTCVLAVARIHAAEARAAAAATQAAPAAAAGRAA